jgi:hypothetical protein
MSQTTSTLKLEETEKKITPKGEKTVVSTSFVRLKETDYVKYYINRNNGYLNDADADGIKIPAPAKLLLMEMCQFMSYCDCPNLTDSETIISIAIGETGGQIVKLDVETKRKIYKNLNVGEDWLHKYLNILLKKEVVRRIDRGVYQINANIASRGSFSFKSKDETGFRGGVMNLQMFYDSWLHLTTEEIIAEFKRRKEERAEERKKEAEEKAKQEQEQEAEQMTFSNNEEFDEIVENYKPSKIDRAVRRTADRFI